MDLLFPNVGFIATNLRCRPKGVVQFYNKRGTAEQWIKEGKHAVKWTRLSCHDFRDNEVRLQLFALAYNLANFMRRLALPGSVKHWSLTTLREKLIKIGAKVVRHALHVTFQMAEVAIPRRLLATILRRIGRLCPVPLQRHAERGARRQMSDGPGGTLCGHPVKLCAQSGLRARARPIRRPDRQPEAASRPRRPLKGPTERV